ncbi:MAG: site-specific DNA-methyltransferase [Lachnospiraceae bacterium]|nr:site-specific DNA-methyltransferase [Lachnospiraceae bacterium]
MDGQLSFEFEQRKPIKGYPELHWTGKRPYTSTQYYPAQLKESFGEPKNGWMNKIFWGDNLQVMSHLLKEYRGKIDLVYIDPPFASSADYVKKIKVKNKRIQGDSSVFEEKQYTDVWNNDEYLQFIYERIILIKELLSEKGTIFLHCDWRVSGYVRLILDEIFGKENFLNEIIWNYSGGRIGHNFFGRKHDTIFWYAKTYGMQTFNYNDVRQEYAESTLKRNQYKNNGSGERVLDYKPNEEGKFPEDVWNISIINPFAKERLDYPTQKPEKLLEDVIKAASNPNDIVFDCFMGSGTTQAVAMKLGRRFIGADINLGAVQTTTKRLINASDSVDDIYKGFEVYNVNNYDFFRNPVEAKGLIVDALGIQKYDSSSVYDGELDGWMVKIMPTNRIATKADLEELKANLPYRTFEKRKEENPNGVVEKIRIICMGHEADLKASLEQELSAYKLEIEILDILRDKTDLQFKREADANVVKEGNNVVIKEFYPMNLLQKLSMQKESVEDWRQLVESIYIDWNYDGETLRPTVCDVPGKDELVSGIYEIPASATRIKIKITDLLSESLELEV